jgi:hypothetical protein
MPNLATEFLKYKFKIVKHEYYDLFNAVLTSGEYRPFYTVHRRKKFLGIFPTWCIEKYINHSFTGGPYSIHKFYTYKEAVEYAQKQYKVFDAPRQKWVRTDVGIVHSEETNKVFNQIGSDVNIG